MCLFVMMLGFFFLSSMCMAVALVNFVLRCFGTIIWCVILYAMFS